MFNLKFASKQLLRDSKRCEKEEKAEKAKLKKAIEKGNMEVARIHAENAIRKKNESLNLLRTSARVDAVSSRVQTVRRTRHLELSAVTEQFQKNPPDYLLSGFCCRPSPRKG